jgi:hypothetical protein
VDGADSPAFDQPEGVGLSALTPGNWIFGLALIVAGAWDIYVLSDEQTLWLL